MCKKRIESSGPWGIKSFLPSLSDSTLHPLDHCNYRFSLLDDLLQSFPLSLVLIFPLFYSMFIARSRVLLWCIRIALVPVVFNRSFQTLSSCFALPLFTPTATDFSWRSAELISRDCTSSMSDSENHRTSCSKHDWYTGKGRTIVTELS